MTKNQFLRFGLIIFSLLLSCVVHGQRLDEIEGYTTSTNTDFYPYDQETKTVNWEHPKSIRPSMVFEIIRGPLVDEKSKTQYYVVKVNNIKSEGDIYSEKENKNVFINSTENGFLWVITLEDFEKKEIKTRFYRGKAQLNVGSLVVPFKMRFGYSDTIPSSTNTEVFLGPSIGCSWRISRYKPYFFTAAATVGLSLINIDSASTNGFVRQPRTIAGLTGGAALIVEFDKFQVGFVLGFDGAFGLDSKQWRYQGAPWISFGIGYQFIKRETDKKSSKKIE